MSDLALSNIINVSITNTPSGLSERNVNSLALFTTETPATLGDYASFVSAQAVVDEYGTSSVTAAMANAIFSQSPNILTGKGQLTIIPLASAVSATQGDIVTADISSNLSNLQAVSDGDLNVTVDSVSYDLTGINLTEAASLADVATIIQGKIANAILTADATTITFTSKKVGESSTVALGAVSGGTGTDLSGASLLNTTAATDTAGVNSSGESIATAITRIGDAVSYTGVITNLEMEDAVLTALATTIQAQDKLFLHHVSSTVDISAGVGATIQAAAEKKTRLIGYTESPTAANLVKSAYAGRAFSVNFSGTDTSQTMNLKQLATVTPDTGISQTLYGQADSNGVDLYVSYAGVPSVFSTGGNDFFDNQYNDLALKFALETAGFNHLRQTNTKVPQTEEGMNGLKNAYSQICVRFTGVGAIAAGSWTSSETFGNPETFRNNILERGFYVYSLPVTEQSSVEREAREAPLVQIAVKRAGAIHTSDVIVLVND